MNKRISRIALLAILIISVFSFVPLKNLTFDFDLEKFFPSDDPDLDYFNEYKTRFSTQVEDEYIFIGLSNNNGVFNKDFLQKIDSLTKYIYSLDEIISVFSITNSSYYVFNDKSGRIVKFPLVRFREPEKIKIDSTVLFLQPELRDFILSKDGKSVTVSAFNTPRLNDDTKKSLLKKIREKIDQLGFDKSYLTAKILVEETYAKETEKNLKLYLSLSLFLTCLVLILLFRSFKTVFVSLMVIILSVCWTLALIAIFDYPIDIVTSLLPPVLAVICMSDIIHIYTKYFEELRKGEEKHTAIKNTFRDIGKATFFTSLTTAIGFYSLCYTDIIPIRLFGVFAGTGVLMAFIIAIIVVFTINLNSPVPKIAGNIRFDIIWTQVLASFFKKLIRHRLKYLVVIFLLLALSALSIRNIKIDSNMLGEIPRNNPILEDYKFIETQFSGTRPFEMALILKDSTSSFLDLEILKEIDELNSFLKDSCHVGMIISPVSFIKSGMQTYNKGEYSEFRIPDNEGDVYFICNKIMQSEWGGELIRYITLDKKHCRISGKLPDLSSSQFYKLTEKVENYFKLNPELKFGFKMTGSAVLFDKTAFSITHNMMYGLLIAFFVISLIVGIMFRSFRMIFIALIVNIIPLVFMAAIMSLLKVNLKADTSIIFSISFGIVVDDTIHYLNRLRLEISKGKSILYANKRALLSTGKAMVITTIILLVGFGTLLFSTFGGTFYIGLLVSLCLIFALITDLTLLPILIILLYKKKNQSTP